MRAVVSGDRNGAVDKAVHMVSKNISSAGAFFITSAVMEPGRELNILLKIPDLTPIKSSKDSTVIQLKGKIVRSEADGIAVAFRSNFRFRPVKKDPPLRI